MGSIYEELMRRRMAEYTAKHASDDLNSNNVVDTILSKGTVCVLLDRVDYNIYHICTIRFVEEDEEVEGVYYYYLLANEDDLNTQEDPRLGKFWTIVGNNDPHIMTYEDFLKYKKDE